MAEDIQTPLNILDQLLCCRALGPREVSIDF